jgi:hypothetical protein
MNRLRCTCQLQPRLHEWRHVPCSTTSRSTHHLLINAHPLQPHATRRHVVWRQARGGWTGSARWRCRCFTACLPVLRSTQEPPKAHSGGKQEQRQQHQGKPGALFARARRPQPSAHALVIQKQVASSKTTIASHCNKRQPAARRQGRR